MVEIIFDRCVKLQIFVEIYSKFSAISKREENVRSPNLPFSIGFCPSALVMVMPQVVNEKNWAGKSQLVEILLII